MSNPAQRPPSDSSFLELATQVTTELLLLGLSCLAGMSLLMVLMWTSVIPESAPWAAIIAGPVFIGTAGAVYLAIEQKLATNDGPVRPLVWGRDRKAPEVCVAIALGGIIAAIAGSALLGLIQEQLFSTQVEEQEAIVALVERGDPFELGLLAASAVILAPLTEELLFRHMFFRRLLHRAGPIAAWALPALAFAFAHWNPVGLVIYVWLGLVFAFCYLVSGRLWVAMAVHAGHNAIVLSLLVYAPDLAP